MDNNTNFIVRAEVDFNQVDYLDESNFNNSKYAIGIGFKANNTIIVTDDGNEYPIKKDTRAIHFDGMLNSEKEKVFASLNGEGKGGDIVTGKCRDINRDELIGIHKPLPYKGIVRFYRETSMSVVIETQDEIIASTKDWSKPLIAQRGEGLRWSDCREDMKVIGIEQ